MKYEAVGDAEFQKNALAKWRRPECFVSHKPSLSKLYARKGIILENGYNI